MKKKDARNLASRAPRPGSADSEVCRIPNAPHETGARWGAVRKSGALRAVVVFTVLVAVFYVVVHSPENEGRVFEPFLRFVATVTGYLLRVLGFEAVVEGRLVRTPEFSFQIVRGCDGLEAIAVFVSAVLASPVSMWSKLAGILLGVLALSVVNFLRIASLFCVAIHFPRAFQFIHEDVWQPAFLLIAVSGWAAWGIWAMRLTRNRAHASR